MSTQRSVGRTPSDPKRRNTGQNSKTDAHSVTKRLQSELMGLMMAGKSTVTAFPEGDNLLSWKATIEGPHGSAYESLSYKLTLKFPKDYPYSAPTVKFAERECFHPNVDEHGNICLDILKDQWSAVYNVRTILLSIQSLLGEPNNNDPLNGEAAALWHDQVEFKKHVLLKYGK